MRIFHHFNDLPADARGAAVAVGNFDGVHRGHQAVIDEAGRIARAADLPWAVLTFEPHPRSVFKPGIEPFRLTPFRSKARHIEALGVDCLIVLQFDLPFSRWPAERFIDDVLVKGLEARHVVSGYDFVFGHDRKGNCELLLHMGAQAGFGFTSVTAVVDEASEVFSATRVRGELAAAEPRAAARLLGHHDFSSFRASACQSLSPVKTLDAFEVIREGEEIRLTARSQSFLHNQMRAMVGSLVWVGEGRWPEAHIDDVLAARDRRSAGPNAPPWGLYLQAVLY